MRSLEIVIKGRIPAKKNSKIRYGVTSKRHQRWHESATIQLLDHKGADLNNVDIQLEFWMPDNIRTDLDNKVSTVFDLLCDLEIIRDDCWQSLQSYYVRAGGIDRKNPRVELWIKEMLI